MMRIVAWNRNMALELKGEPRLGLRGVARRAAPDNRAGRSRYRGRQARRPYAIALRTSANCLAGRRRL
jgi:hypothetical protein